jgi:quercetin dioxygenase-like cupin family protein
MGCVATWVARLLKSTEVCGCLSDGCRCDNRNRETNVRTPAIVAASLSLLVIGLSRTSMATTMQEGSSVDMLFRAPLADVPGTDVAIIRVDYGPGAATPPHEHPAFVYAYVLSGAVVSRIGEAPPETYRQGQMWSELPWQHHTVSRNASSTKPASLLVFFIIPHRAPLTVMLPSSGDSSQATTPGTTGTH